MMELLMFTPMKWQQPDALGPYCGVLHGSANRAQNFLVLGQDKVAISNKSS